MLKKCLFPVAGYGTRFLPATKAMPKEMLPILDKPLVQYGVEEAVEAGLTDISFVTGRSKRAIEDHFDTSYELEHQIEGTDKEKALRGIRQLIDKSTFSYTRQTKWLAWDMQYSLEGQLLVMNLLRSYWQMTSVSVSLRGF